MKMRRFWPWLLLAAVIIVAGGRLVQMNDDVPTMAEADVVWINLRHTADDAAAENNPQQIDIEEAVVGFVAAEMPMTYPDAALQAQAVAARSFVYCRNLAAGEVCDDSTHCLAYLDEQGRKERWGRNFAEYEAKVRQAVGDTGGQVLAVDGQPVAAYFHAVCGGMTENAADCWGGEGSFEAAPCFWDGGAAKALSSCFWPKDKLAAKLGVDEADLALLVVTSHTGSGRVARVACKNKSWTGAEIRSLLGLNSTAFAWLATAEGFWFTVQGYGHGVGLCQAGAAGMAEQGYDYQQILAHYYAGAELQNLNPTAAQ
ncbi:MAG: SpoIID/LytB domain-containing protein [Firmicutes bacterium]|nr:SpoIID/LytB domain-containing protein [Bacillota bacterium]